MYVYCILNTRRTFRLDLEPVRLDLERDGLALEAVLLQILRQLCAEGSALVAKLIKL